MAGKKKQSIETEMEDKLIGGYKQSGIGRENDKEILDAYSQTKNIMINLNEVPSGFYPAK